MLASASSSSYRRVPQNEQQAAAAVAGAASVDSGTSMMQRSHGERLQNKCAAGTYWKGIYCVATGGDA
jgi:hypothetical protein